MRVCNGVRMENECNSGWTAVDEERVRVRSWKSEGVRRGRG